MQEKLLFSLVIAALLGALAASMYLVVLEKREVARISAFNNHRVRIGSIEGIMLGPVHSNPKNVRILIPGPPPTVVEMPCEGMTMLDAPAEATK